MIRRLYIVPIIHMSADMGSVALSLEQAASAVLPSELWQQHKKTIASFWDSIGRFFDSLNVQGVKVYQDGLVADGTDGLRIVREGTAQGSKNYEIIGSLLERGAILIKTEELSLIKQEYSYIAKMTAARSWKERGTAALRYRLVRDKLLKQRDEFIARRINDTLCDGQIGILFIGAYHNIVPNLHTGIKLVQVKEMARVKEYQRALIAKRRCARSLHELDRYLISPVSPISEV